MNVVEDILAFNAGRDPDRLKLKYAAMRASPFAFFRGSCHLFYARLPRDGIFKSAPLAWSCGDLHLENFGSYKGDNRLVYFDINDFDEAALAPASWDPVRLLASLRIAADGRAIARSDADQLCAVFVDTYALRRWPRPSRTGSNARRREGWFAPCSRTSANESVRASSTAAVSGRASGAC